MDIVKKIDDIRIKKGWTFYRLSQESGLTQQTFSKWMSGKSQPTLAALTKICKAYGISVVNFLAENNMVEVTPETKVIFDNWCFLTKEEQASIKSIIENYINKNK